MTLRDGERVTIQGSTAAYQLSRRGPVFACSCPAWTKQTTPPARRTCKHLRAHLGDEHEDARVGDTRLEAARARAVKSAQATRDPPALRAHRQAGLAAALARFPAAAARMRAVYDMPLPRHLAHAIGFWLGLTDDERKEAWSHCGCGPAGVGEWFEDGGLDRVPALDERLHYRYRRDPPEFVTVFSGNSDGGHWGLWYDDPRELPRQIAHNYARDDGETGARKPTLLATLREGFTRERIDPKDYPHAKRILAWLDECHVLELAAHREEKIPSPPLRTSHCIGGMDPVVRGATLPADFACWPANHQRLEVYRKDPATTRTWIARALQELAAGEPLRALFLARELHWLDDDALRDEARDLGVRAYEAVGRKQLADVLRVHCEHRDLRSVDIYKEAPPPPLVLAVCENDEPRVRELLPTATPADIAAAVRCTVALPLLDLLLAAAPPELAAARLADTLDTIVLLRTHDHDPAAHEAVFDHLFARAVDPIPAFIRALAGDSPTHLRRVVDNLDLARRDAEGRTPLHHAVTAGAVDLVREFLARGADPLARDAHGKLPHDRARDIWQDKRSESLALLALLPGSPPPPAAPTTALTVGDRVLHDKFGPGSVLATTGTGDALKLTIAFTDAQRTLLARFVRPA